MNLTKIRAALRQRAFPEEFRIEEPLWSEEWLETLRKLAEEPPPGPPPKENNDEEERMRFLADMATGIWRLRQKMLEPGTERPKEQFRREYRHLESVWDLLKEAGIQIQDHTGKPFDSGQAIKVLAFQPVPGVQRERVQDTVKPTIYFKDRHIQMGEVLVATPEKSSSESASSSPAVEQRAEGSAKQ